MSDLIDQINFVRASVDELFELAFSDDKDALITTRNEAMARINALMTMVIDNARETKMLSESGVFATPVPRSSRGNRSTRQSSDFRRNKV